MVAHSGTMSDSESCSSSNSDAEELARCREAAMPAWGLELRPQEAEKPRADAAGKRVPASQPSLRREVNQHSEDGNELQTTPEFRAHVAKKLGAMLDSSITISEVWKKPSKAEAQQEAGEEDGFRLFFTSIPGSREKETPPKPCRKRQPASSSEDSEEERLRCREAAVSASDILQESAIHCPAKVEKEAEKRVKKKAKRADSDSAGATGLKQVKEAVSINGDPASLGTKKKKRKKKSKKAREASPCPPAGRALAGSEN
ncbi:hypothetical protein HispidOSU_025128 [Sigmodon hispidus]